MNKKTIYADNAATTKLDIEAFESMKPYLLENYGNASSLYSMSKVSKKAMSESRATIAECIGAIDNEIYFTSGGTESDNWGIKGTAYSLRSKGKHIITSTIEHHAVLNSCKQLEELGFDVTYLEVDNTGTLSPEILEKAIRSDTILVSIMIANNEIGTIQNIKQLADIAHKHNILFHTDAVQAVGHIPINVVELGIDMLSASAHKFNGPKGIGFLYLKDGVELGQVISGGHQESDMRAGTENIASIVGMATALEKNTQDMSVNQKYIRNLSYELLSKLSESDLRFLLNGDSKNRLPGNINISIFQREGEVILHRMDLKGICISTGSACNSQETEISHVIKAIGVPNDYASGTIRISLGKYNTYEEVKIIADTLLKICL